MCALMLEFAREGPLPLHRQAFALADLVEEVRYSLPPDARGRVELDNKVPAAFEVHADRDQLFRVLSNLCRNAVEAGATHLDISAREDTDRRFIDVADDGPGLPEAVRDKLFQPFAGSARPGGTGLGLAIARDIMRAHGGDITPLATGTDGTTFRLELPTRNGAPA
jgi:signal transduction histidine kinase